MSSAAPVAAIAVLSLSVVACGGSETSTDTNADPGSRLDGPVAAAVDATLDAGTARVGITFEFTRSGGYFSETGDSESAEGVVDFEQRRNEWGMGVEQVIVDETAFYLAPAEPGETAWKKYDLATKDGDALAPDVSFGRFDVTRQLEYVASIADSFTAAGEEDVRGATTTRYTGDGDAETLMHALVSDFLYEHLPWSTHVSTVEPSDLVPFDVWVGEDGRVHRLEYEFPEFDSLVGQLTTLELDDFGTGVDIELPAETVDG